MKKALELIGSGSNAVEAASGVPRGAEVRGRPWLGVSIDDVSGFEGGIDAEALEEFFALQTGAPLSEAQRAEIARLRTELVEIEEPAVPGSVEMTRQAERSVAQQLVDGLAVRPPRAERRRREAKDRQRSRAARRREHEEAQRMARAQALAIFRRGDTDGEVPGWKTPDYDKGMALLLGEYRKVRSAKELGALVQRAYDRSRELAALTGVPRVPYGAEHLERLGEEIREALRPLERS